MSEEAAISTQVQKPPKQPVFDTKVDLVVFSLSDPLNYTVTSHPVGVTEDGLYINKQNAAVSSSSDEEADYLIKSKK